MRKGPKAAVGQLWNASVVAWTNPDWVAKTVGNVGSTFVQSVAVANRLQLDVRTPRWRARSRNPKRTSTFST